MDPKASRTSKFAATVLITVNIGVMLFCSALFAISLWIITSPQSLSTSIQNIGSPVLKVLLPSEVLTVQLGVAIVVFVTFIAFIAFMGCYGAMNRSQFLLFMYSALVLLLLLLECALIFYFSSSLIEKGPQEGDGQWAHALRLAFHCCEHNYTYSIPQPQEVTKLPWSCCGVSSHPNNCTVSKIYVQNCQSTIRNWMQRYQTGVYASLAALHIILASCSLVRRSRKSSHSYS